MPPKNSVPPRRKKKKQPDTPSTVNDSVVSSHVSQENLANQSHSVDLSLDNVTPPVVERSISDSVVEDQQHDESQDNLLESGELKDDTESGIKPFNTTRTSEYDTFSPVASPKHSIDNAPDLSQQQEEVVTSTDLSQSKVSGVDDSANSESSRRGRGRGNHLSSSFQPNSFGVNVSSTRSVDGGQYRRSNLQQRNDTDAKSDNGLSGSGSRVTRKSWGSSSKKANSVSGDLSQSLLGESQQSDQATPKSGLKFALTTPQGQQDDDRGHRIAASGRISNAGTSVVSGTTAADNRTSVGGRSTRSNKYKAFSRGSRSDAGTDVTNQTGLTVGGQVDAESVVYQSYVPPVPSMGNHHHHVVDSSIPVEQNTPVVPAPENPGSPEFDYESTQGGKYQQVTKIIPFWEEGDHQHDAQLRFKVYFKSGQAGVFSNDIIHGDKPTALNTGLNVTSTLMLAVAGFYITSMGLGYKKDVDDNGGDTAWVWGEWPYLADVYPFIGGLIITATAVILGMRIFVASTVSSYHYARGRSNLQFVQEDLAVVRMPEGGVITINADMIHQLREVIFETSRESYMPGGASEIYMGEPGVEDAPQRRPGSLRESAIVLTSAQDPNLFRELGFNVQEDTASGISVFSVSPYDMVTVWENLSQRDRDSLQLTPSQVSDLKVAQQNARELALLQASSQGLLARAATAVNNSVIPTLSRIVEAITDIQSKLTQMMDRGVKVDVEQMRSIVRQELSQVSSAGRNGLPPKLLDKLNDALNHVEFALRNDRSAKQGELIEAKFNHFMGAFTSYVLVTTAERVPDFGRELNIAGAREELERSFGELRQAATPVRVSETRVSGTTSSGLRDEFWSATFFDDAPQNRSEESGDHDSNEEDDLFEESPQHHVMMNRGRSEVQSRRLSADEGSRLQQAEQGTGNRFTLGQGVAPGRFFNSHEDFLANGAFVQSLQELVELSNNQQVTARAGLNSLITSLRDSVHTLSTDPQALKYFRTALAARLGTLCPPMQQTLRNEFRAGNDHYFAIIRQEDINMYASNSNLLGTILQPGDAQTEARNEQIKTVAELLIDGLIARIDNLATRFVLRYEQLDGLHGDDIRQAFGGDEIDHDAFGAKISAFIEAVNMIVQRVNQNGVSNQIQNIGAIERVAQRIADSVGAFLDVLDQHYDDTDTIVEQLNTLKVSATAAIGALNAKIAQRTASLSL